MERLDCKGITPHHSDDVFLLYCGKVEPLRVCGYHEKYHLADGRGWEIAKANQKARTGRK